LILFLIFGTSLAYPGDRLLYLTASYPKEVSSSE
jgi:hypothetical protein